MIDNGNGMMESKMNQIYKRIEEIISSKSYQVSYGRYNGMGIINSVLRLKMMYGESFKFSISNNDDNRIKIYLEL